MLRRAYLLALLVLQFALVTEVVPALAEALRLRAAIAQAGGSDDAILRLAVAMLGTIGGGIALVAPLFALLRHRQRGPLRFLGLPRWAVIGLVAGADAVRRLHAGGGVAVRRRPPLWSMRWSRWSAPSRWPLRR